MFDKNKLIKKMYEKGFNQQSLSKEIGISSSSFSRKINGICPIYLSEVDKICHVLNIDRKSELTDIFFAECVPKMQQ